MNEGETRSEVVDVVEISVRMDAVRVPEVDCECLSLAEWRLVGCEVCCGRSITDTWRSIGKLRKVESD
jgi:hypothetical protein